MRNGSDKSFRENQETHHVHFFFFNRSVYERIWKNNVEHGRPQMTIWHICIACWISKATNTHSEYVILVAFPLQQWLMHVSQCYVVHTLHVLSNYMVGILFFLYSFSNHL